MPIVSQFRTVKLAPLPWRIIAGHEKQAQRNHMQSLARLRERGGLSPCEAVAILEDRRWHQMTEFHALERLAAIVAAASDALP